MKRKIAKLLVLPIIACILTLNVSFANASENKPVLTQQEAEQILQSQQKSFTLSNQDSSLNIVQPNGFGITTVGSYVSVNSNSTWIWYSGNMTSDATWVSASLTENLLYMSPLGGSWYVYQSQSPVYSSNANYMTTPTYIYPASAGYWMSRNDYVVYFPPNTIPLYLNDKVYSNYISVT
ncbi:MAG: hypothetical protein GX434_08100 [Peptococcaceae bacterium]|nr:hypothetical protein [Peptococcaceae bacterium]